MKLLGKKVSHDSEDQKTIKKRSWKSFFLFDPNDRFLSYYHTFMMLMITYSCFSSAYFCAFQKPKDDYIFTYVEHLVFASFSTEIILKFMTLPDSDEDEKNRTHKAIAKKYIKSGWFFFDFIATIPFYLVTDMGNNGIWFKLMRMIRIPRIIDLLDVNRFNKIMEKLISGQPRSKRVYLGLLLKNLYKVGRLIMLTLIIIYFIGCFFYLFSDLQTKHFDYTSPTFITQNNLGGDEKDSIYDLISVCYFAITTLTTVGYGDLVPQTNAEKIVTNLMMIAGVAFFSFIMGSFIEIISQFRGESLEKQTFELHDWMTLITRFRDNKPLPHSMYQQINEHFKYFWSNNRLANVQKTNEFITALPRPVRRAIIVHYLFDDIFYQFRFFFNPQKYKETKFLYEVAFGLKPRQFLPIVGESIIYDEEDSVMEMYFITSGTVGVGYHQYQLPSEVDRLKLTHQIEKGGFFGDYYLMHNMKAEFVHVALTLVEAFALSRKFLLRSVFPNYPQILREIKDDSLYRYNTNIKDEIMKHKNSHLEIVNKRNTYHSIFLKVKQLQSTVDSEFQIANSKTIHKNLRFQFQERINGIEIEMAKVDQSLNEFIATVSTDFNGLIGKIDQMKNNMEMLKNQRVKSHFKLAQLKPEESFSLGSRMF